LNANPCARHKGFLLQEGNIPAFPLGPGIWEKIMHVRINGEDLLIVSLISVAVLIAQRKLRPETVVVEYNGAILAPDKWEMTVLEENDTLEILSFVGGG
jgi:sulfur carrier protein